MSEKDTSREDEDFFEELESAEVLGRLMKVVMSSSTPTSPDSLYSQNMVRDRFGIGINRVRRLQAHIIKLDMDHAPDGKSIIAPLGVWYKAMKEVR